ncbi:hypothetical protein Mapa_010210 [Marchantia paleacea]|nr:hypothetical protein Mapa_010210 [Marchantia paleacea]
MGTLGLEVDRKIEGRGFTPSAKAVKYSHCQTGVTFKVKCSINVQGLSRVMLAKLQKTTSHCHNELELLSR